MAAVVKKLAGEIALAPSAAFAESVLHYGMIQGRDVTLRGCGCLGLSDDLQQFAATIGYGLDSSDDGITLSQQIGFEASKHPIPSRDNSDFFRKMLAMARAECDTPLVLPDDTGDDFELELILHRRMGFGYELLDGSESQLCKPTVTPTSAMKYRLPEKNYHLFEPIVSGVMASGCTVELISPFEIDPSAWSAYPTLGIDVESRDEIAEQDELSRRINRLKPATKQEFRYIVKKLDILEDRIEIDLPGDHMVGLFAAGTACLIRNSSIKISNILKTRGISSAFRVLARMGAEVDIAGAGNELSSPLCDVTIASGELIGKRFSGDSIRACPEVSCVLASLGMIAEGKTVIRDLPFGSDFWRARVGSVREILDSCGARVGEIEDGLVVEGGGDLMMMTYLNTGDEMCELTQQMLSLALPHHSSYRDPAHFKNSVLFKLYNGLTA
jgi:hypothetical protein